MKKVHEFVTDKEVFKFEMEYRAMNAAGENFFAPNLSCLIYRTDVPDKTWQWSGVLPSPPQQIEFQLAYDDRIDIKGYFNLFHSVESEENFVFVDVHYGINEEEHFEGNVFQINASSHDEPIIPVPPRKETPLNPPDEFITADNFKDLFPYLYLQYWPKVQEDEQVFLIHIPADLSSSSFYAKLIGLLQSETAREEIEEEALKYINGDAPYEDAFIAQVANLEFPFDIYPEVYDYIYYTEDPGLEEALGKLELSEEENDEPPVRTRAEIIQQIWDNIIALLIIDGYDVFLFEQLSKVLIVDNLLTWLENKEETATAAEVQELIHASLVLPEELFPLPKFKEESTEQEVFTGAIVPYAIGDLQLVQYQIKGYQLGDLARVENVMSGELKKSRQRKRETRSEATIEQHDSRTQQEENYESNALESQVNKSISNEIKETFNYDKLETSYGPPTTGTYNGSVEKTGKHDITQKGPFEFAKRIVSKSINQIGQQISTRRHHILRNETEESVANIIDNRQGNQNIRGIYYWLNRVYKLRLINYGHRFMLEFLIQNPAINNTTAEASPIPTAPVAPVLLPTPIKSFKDITLENYLELADIYFIINPPLPPAPNKITTALIKGDKLTSYIEMLVPEDYFPQEVVVNYNITNPAVLIAGNEQEKLVVDGPPITIENPLGDFSSSDVVPAGHNLVLPIAVNTGLDDETSNLFTPYFVNLLLTSQVSTALMNRWQQEMYQLIQQAYQDQREAYKKSMEKQFEGNPEKANLLIGKMVKSACEQLLWQQHLQINGVPETTMTPTENNVNKPAYAQFFETAFEWNKMIFTLDQTLSTNKTADLIKELENTNSNNKIEQFLEAEQIRVILPLQTNYNYKMLYYLAAGQIFYGTDHLTPVLTSDEALAVKLKKVFELAAPHHLHELESWEQEVPTEMQWLEENAVGHLFLDNV